MAFSSQFSLSLELTNLLPIGPAVNLFGGAMTKLARELTAYGSDIVVEEDLAAIFGRLKICQHFERTFRVAVGVTERTALSSVLDIVLESGPGPTVRRALTAKPEDYRYLSTVIQLSLLSHVHELSSLAEALSDILRRRLEGAPSDHAPPPGYDALHGVLRACQEQTNRFQWHHLLDRVCRDLGEVYDALCASIYPAECRPRNSLAFQAKALAISPVIIQGLLDMLLATQSLPEDRSIHIQTVKGIPTIITWAHHILGFTVHVNILDKDEVMEAKRFGPGQPQVIIDADQSQQVSENSICLLNASEEGILFRLKDEDGEERPLEASLRRPLGGFARAVIESGIKQRVVDHSSGEEISHLLDEIAVDVLYHGICSFATNVLRKYRIHETSELLGNSLNELRSNLQNTPYNSWDRIESAIRMLFGQEAMGLDDKVFRISRGPNSGSSSKLYYQKWKNPELYYYAKQTLKINIGPLITLVRMLSCVENVEDCIDLQIPIDFGEDTGTDMSRWTGPSKQRSPWEAIVWGGASSNGCWSESSLMESFAPILLGTNFYRQEGNGGRAFKRTGLISGFGWSAYLPTVEIMDPYLVTYFRIILRRGVPIRNGDLRRRIEDPSQPVLVLPEKGGEYSLLTRGEGDNDEAARCESDTENDFNSVDLSSICKDQSYATFARTRVGVTHSTFVVGFVLESSSWGKATVGIRAMNRLGGSYNVRKADPCTHEPRDIRQVLSESKPGANIYIAASSDPILPGTVPNKKRYKSHNLEGYFILPSSGSAAGRWLAICLWQEQRTVIWVQHPHRTCLQCILPFAMQRFEPRRQRYITDVIKHRRIFLL